MTREIACKYCRSTDVPTDLVCVEMCDWCCTNGLDVLTEDHSGPIAQWMIRRVLRWLRHLGDDCCGVRDLRPLAEALNRER